MTIHKIQLKYAHPYSFEHTFRRLRYFEKSSYIYSNDTFIRTIRWSNEPLLLRVSHNSTKKWIEVEIEGDCPDTALESLTLQLSRMFSTQVNLKPLYQQFENDPHLHPILQNRAGMHFILEPSIYECLMKTIISQQLNLSFAATLLERFIQLAGTSIESNGESFFVFPTPEKIAGLHYEDLQELQFSRRKAEYLIDTSRHIVEGHLDLESLYEKSTEEIFNQLLPIRGIGRWTIECLLLFGFGRPNLLPAADIGLRNALQNVYQLDKQPGVDQVREIGESWSPYASYVTFYLWDTLSDNSPKKRRKK